METFISSLLGCFFALLICRVLENWARPKNEPTKGNEPITREAPKNIGRFKDPLAGYEKYKKEDGLYRPIKNKVVKRIEIGSDNDSN